MKIFKVVKFISYNNEARRISTCKFSSFQSNFNEKPNWDSVVKEAESVVGYPTSFLSLRWILNDEIANVAAHIRRLIGTNHPLLKTAKSLLLRNEQPTWGLIVLLISKAAGLNSSFPELECDRTADILHSQRILAEVTEMIKTSHLIHKGIMTVDPSHRDFADLNFGNKLALLCGDYLLSTSFHEVAKLKNFHVQETISSTLRDLSEGEFLGRVPSIPLPLQEKISIPVELGVTPFKVKEVLGHMKSEWILRNILSGGSLLGRGCQCSLILANHDTHVQKLGYTFGTNLALAWQASSERDLFNDSFSLLSAPVMFHLEYDPEFYSVIEKEDVDLNHIRNTVMKGPGLEKTKKLQEELSQLALKALNEFPDSDSKAALVKIVNFM